MKTFKLLSSAQINFLNLVLKEHNYMGKASTSCGKTVKLYSFQPSVLQYQDYSAYLSKVEYDELCSLTQQYVFSPYFRLIIRSLKDLVETKKLTLNFKHQFYDVLPNLGLDLSHMSEQARQDYLIDINNSFQDFRCKACGHLMSMSSCDCYFEYYTCINKPHCSYNIRVN